jgi:Na+/proline symporter
VRAARQVILINGVGIIIFILLLSLTGLIIYSFYADCDPYMAGFVNSSNQLFPYFVMEVLHNKKGLPGIFLACIFSASLSTISSGLNSLTAVFIEDIQRGLMRRQLNDEQLGRVSQIFSVILGAVVMVLTFTVSYLGSVLNAALSLGGVFSGPIMGVFFLGFFFPRVNRRSALVGLLISLAMQLWIFLGAQITKTQGRSSHLPLLIANCSKLNTTRLPSANMTAIEYGNE